jgi:hypothetical protein
MNRPHHNGDDLERFIDQTLRDLGQRQAPPTLESRVLAELGRRAALPWWRKPFAHWPLAARAAFVLACLGSIQLAVVAVMWVSANGYGLWTHLMSWMRGLGHLTSSMAGLVGSLIGVIPPSWLYAAAACAALLYGCLFGLGAIGYHILYAEPTYRGSPQR